MGAAWAHARADLKRRWISWSAIGALVAIAGGVAVGAWAGARRGASAHGRLLAEVAAPDVWVEHGNPGFEESDGLPFESVAHPAEVVLAGRQRGVLAGTVTDDGLLDPENELSTAAVLDDVLMQRMGRPHLAAGRMPLWQREDEALITQSAADRYRLRVGDEVPLAVLTLADAERLMASGDLRPPQPPVRFTVVGIAADVRSILNVGDAAAMWLTPAFARSHPGSLTWQGTAIALRGGQADVAAYRHTLERAAQGRLVGVTSRDDARVPLDDAVEPQTTSLVLFALVVAVTGLVLAAQAIGRQVDASAGEAALLRALGLSRRQLVLSVGLRVLVTVVPGGLAAALFAVVGSRWTPIGVARPLEPTPGPSVDGWAISLGAGMLVVGVLLAAAPGALRWARATGTPSTAAARPGPVARVLPRLFRFGVASEVGSRMAVAPERWGRASPIRAGVGASLVGLIAILASLAFAAGLQHLAETPRLYGWGFDAIVGNAYGDIPAARTRAFLDGDRDVEAIAGVRFSSVTVEGEATDALGLTAGAQGVAPPVIEGRLPQSPDEVALGVRARRATGAILGDRVTVAAGPRRERLEVVGTVVTPDLDASGGVGHGVVLTDAGLARLVDDNPVDAFLVELRVGADHGAFRDRVHSWQDEQLTRDLRLPERPADVVNLHRVRGVPFALAGVLGAIGALTLAHVLVGSVRRRRADFAVLGAIGFVRRQVRVVVIVQSTVLIGVALALAVPLGLASGRWAWTVVAEAIGTVAEPVTPIGPTVAVAVGALLLASVVAALPGGRAARVRPAAALRAE